MSFIHSGYAINYPAFASLSGDCRNSSSVLAIISVIINIREKIAIKWVKMSGKQDKFQIQGSLLS